MNEIENYGTPLYHEGPAPRIISRRLYNLLLTGLILASFAIMGVCSYMTSTADFQVWLAQNSFVYMIGTMIGSFGGLIAMNIGRSRENLTLAFIGYALFTLTFGFTTSLALSYYSLESISLAFTATAGIMVVFGVAGMAFPAFFTKVAGVGFTALLALVVIEVIVSLMGIQQNVTSMIVVVLFCGFIGYDVYRASVATPTVSNALWFAVELYLDIINVFLRLLQIFGNRDN